MVYLCLLSNLPCNNQNDVILILSLWRRYNRIHKQTVVKESKLLSQITFITLLIFYSILFYSILFYSPQVRLDSLDEKYSVLSALSATFNHTVHNSRLREIKTLKDALLFYKVRLLCLLILAFVG